MFLVIILANLTILGTGCWFVVLQMNRQNRKHHSLQENAGDAVVVFDKNGKLKYASPSIHKVLGYTAKEIVQMDFTKLAHPSDLAALAKIMNKVMSNPGVPIVGHMGQMLHGDGTWHWYEATVTNMLHDKDIKGIVDNFRDITQTVIAKEKTRNANRLYGFISLINQAIVQTYTEQDLFAETCRIATDFGKFKMAWIGVFNNDFTRVTITSGNGIPEQVIYQFNDAQVSCGDPMSEVINSGSSFVCNDISDFKNESWRLFADQHGIGSFMILPLKRELEIVGALSLYAETAGFFNQQEIGLLEEVVADISFAMNSIKRERSRVKAEKSLKNSELRLKQAQAIANVGSFEIDFSSGIATWSEELCRIYGFGSNENLHFYEDWLAFVHPEDIQHVREVVEQTRTTLESPAIYHRIIRKDGMVRHLLSQGEFDLDANGQPIGMHGAAHDMTTIKESEVARTQSEQNLQLIMDLIPQCIFIKDVNGCYRFVNESFAALYGVSATEFLEDDSYQQMEIEQERNLFLQQDKQVIQSGQTLTIPEALFTGVDGAVRYFYMVKVPYMLDIDKEMGMLGIALDITQQKQADLDRTRMIGDLIKRNKDLEQFSYVVSHNVRAPMVNIISLISLLDPDGTCEDDQVLSALRHSTSKLDSVILDLNFILNMNHDFTESMELVNFNSIIEDIKLSIANLIQSSGVQIITDFGAVAQTYCIKSYMHSIFYNLILNSIKYRRSGVVPQIRISSSIINGVLEFEFNDNGLGIDLTKFSNDIFGLYKRFHPGIEGKGMGLYMVKNQIEQLGGNIVVESTVGMGTTFRISLGRVEKY